MELIRTIWSRLSGGLFASVPRPLRRMAELSRTPVLRLVSDKSTGSTAGDLLSKRPGTQAGGQLDALEEALRRSQSWFLARQHTTEGYWVAELEADSTLTSEYLMLRRFLGLVDPEREEKAVRYLTSAQLADGGWPIYYGGPAEISASVKAYFALKLSGVSAREPFMIRARDRILAMGGVVRANVFTKITLALFGQYDWRGIPSMPPEIMLLPRRFYFSVYAISYWSRAVLIPLLIVFAHRPLCRIPDEQGIAELYTEPRAQVRYQREPPFRKDRRWLTARNCFITLDRLLKLYDEFPVRWLRERALSKAATWMLAHLKGTGGLGAIYPAMANSIVALRCLGYGAHDTLVKKALGEIEELEVRDTVQVDGHRVEALHLQPCFSPVWDTSLLINALIEAGMSQEHPALIKAGSWLISKQTNAVGDWSVSAPKARPGGWYFQFENEFYQDVDD